MKKGKLYKVIWMKWMNTEPPPTHGIYMNTRYNAGIVFVKHGEILLYLGNKKRYHPFLKDVSWRAYRFLYGGRVLTWTEREQTSKTAVDVFERVGEQTGAAK